MNNIFYSDIDLSFEKTINNDIKRLINNDSIKNSIINLISFNVHDIFLNDMFGGFLKDLLFEADSDLDLGLISDRIEWILSTYENRIIVNEVDCEFLDNNILHIDISYTIKKDNKKENFTFIRDLK